MTELVAVNDATTAAVQDENQPNLPTIDVMKHDLAIISNWVRQELFRSVKFVYEPEKDCVVDGSLFKQYIKSCASKLIGMQVHSQRSKEYKILYLKNLWGDATQRKNNLVMDGLNARRSGIYSAMQNRFTGKSIVPCVFGRNIFLILYLCFKDLCKYCREHNVVLPSIEAFEEMIRIPCVYVVFYEYFFKSAVGDSDWKTACVGVTDASAPLGNYQTEAFAFLVLRNNYFAWLLDVKKKAKDSLVTDYDTLSFIKETRSQDVGEVFLKVEIDLEVNADNDEEDDDDDDEEDNNGFGNHPKNDLLVHETTCKRRYDRLRARTEAKIELVRERARRNPKYQELLQALQEMEGTQQVNEAAATGNERRTKRRRLLRDFRVYTNGRDDQNKYKGWSKRAKNDLADLTMKCRHLADEVETKRFREAYRLTFAERVQSAKKPQRPDDNTPAVDHEEDIWGFGNSDDVDTDLYAEV